MNILIVEDNEETREFLTAALKEEGFVVDVAADGKVGSQKAKDNNYDLIILDNTLPHKSGREICKEIRKRGDGVPILMLSVKSEVDEKVSLLEAGVDDYLTKPFSFEELRARIKALLRRPQTIEHEIYKIGEVTLDVNGKKVMRGSAEIFLAGKEFQLLEYLLRKRGVVVPRAEILEHVWDMNADPFTNTIETHVLNLRKKIGAGDLIHTVRGVGYKIE